MSTIQSTANRYRTTFTLRAALYLIACAMMVLVSARSAGAQTAPFDDLGNATPVPPGYGAPGLVWNNWLAVNAQTYGGPNTPGCIVTDPNCASNGGGSLASITSATPFTFNGGYFMGWYNSTNGGYGGPITLTVTGYNGANMVGTQTLNLNSSTAQLYTFDYANVDNVTFDTNVPSGNWYLADNLTFNTTTTPEPASLTLLATGLVGIVGAARRRARKSISR